MWTYGGDPSANDRDAVRFLIGDTDETDPLIDDEEIAFLLAQSPNIYIASANACDHLAAEFGNQLSRRSVNLNPEKINRFELYQKLANQYRSTATKRSAAPFAGGISVADKDNRDLDTDRVKPSFTTKLQEIDTGDATNFNNN